MTPSAGARAVIRTHAAASVVHCLMFVSGSGAAPAKKESRRLVAQHGLRQRHSASAGECPKSLPWLAYKQQAIADGLNG